MKFYIFLGLLTACLAQEGSNSRQNKAWKFTDESNKSPSPEESVREERTIDILQPSKDEREREPKILDAGTSATTNRSAEQVEGRFFLKDKLCLLGLADCNPKRAYQGGGGALNLGGIQYVQPIKVVPHGAPIAAVPIANPHQQTGYQAPKPSYGVPKPTYNAPKPSYDAPKPVYNAPKPSYGAPKPVYNAPKPSYGAPKPSYGAPQPSYGAPKPSYGAPKPSYGAPSNTYGAPSSSNLGYQSSSLDTYGVDRYQGQLTGNIYSHPYQTNFGSVALKRDDDGSHNHGGHHHGSGNSHHGSGNSHHGSGNSHHGSGNSHHGSTNIHHGAGNSHHGAGNSHHGSGSSHHGSGSSHHGLGNSHQGSVNTQFTSQTFQNSPQQSSFHVSSPSPPRRGNRQGRLEDDCYCVPISQCPSFTTTGPVFTTGSNAKQLPNSQRKDYSHLINPRNKVTSIEAEEDEDEKVESVDPTKPEAKESNEKDEPKKREVRTGKALETPKKEESQVEVKSPESRKKRDVEEPQDFTDPNFNAGEVLSPRQRAPFGPNGIKPPTCGYPNSGYVCCSISSGRPTVTQFTGGSSEFQQFTTQKNNRAVNSGGRFTTFNSNVNNNNNNNNIKLTSTSTPGQCGQRNSQGINGRITGTLFERKNGETEFGEYPWQVAILKKDTLDNVYLCAGSLIDGSHVITAAHCVRGYNPDELVLRLGEWDVNNDSEFYTHIEIDAKHIFVHEKFYPGNLYNDIAVIRLNKYVDFSRNRHISPVCLPDTFHSFAGQRCYVTGWGKDAFLEGNYQHILKEVNVPVLDNGRCERLLRQSKLGPDFVLDKGFLCAGGEEGKDACKGDGGGPLVCEVNGLWQLAGIVSWGIGCGEYNVPGVYVKVSEYEEWIQRQLLRAF
eukprot:TRINITY_DN476_c0_g1_i5.p1 TRINITY_DN476_c0_g1~~TRINITY_DN476_c0_g1_i5.p1  ORF type:complete len:888 (-),score=210.15 TRINITY_DN476_c0_g1_i5:343-3006(-)